MGQQEQMVPALRFPEFAGEWKCMPMKKWLKKVIDYRGKPPPKADVGVRLITARNVKMGYLDFDANEYIDTDQYESWMNRGLPVSGDVMLTTEAPLGNVARFPKEGKFALGQRIITLQPSTQNCYSGFLFQALLAPKMQYEIQSRGTGTTAKGIKSKLFIKILLSAPKIEEQQKIAAFLGAVDEKIAQLQKKKYLLEDYKKGCMQKLFSQELRFKDEGGQDFPDWEEKPLGKLVELINGLTYSPENIREDGMLVLRSSNIQKSEITLEDSVYVNLSIDEDKKSQINDILLCVRNGSQRLIGKSAIIKSPLKNTTHGAFMTMLRGDQNEFVFQLLQTHLFFREVHKNLGATINSINGADLKKMKFFIPLSSIEKDKIAQFLSALDEKIALISEELEKAKTFKKGLLQQMFV